MAGHHVMISGIAVNAQYSGQSVKGIFLPKINSAKAVKIA